MWINELILIIIFLFLAGRMIYLQAKVMKLEYQKQQWLETAMMLQKDLNNAQNRP